MSSKILTVIEGVLRFEDNPITSGVTVILRQNKFEIIILSRCETLTL